MPFTGTPPHTVTVFRTAMCGGGLSYDVLVDATDVPEHIRQSTRTQIWRDGGYYYHYVDATISAGHDAMPHGWERYDDYLRHEEQARREMLNIACVAFPELEAVKAVRDSLPLLWVTGLLAAETSEKKIVQVGPRPTV